MKKNKNYLENIPCPNPKIKWTLDNEGIVTLEIENKGIFNRIAQKLFKKPPVTYIHLDKTGSFVWPLINGEKSIAQLAGYVDAEFGQEAHPLYERLAKFFQILESYGFITYKAG